MRPIPVVNQPLPDEPREQALRGPFAGICSEMPADAIELFGFTDCLNMILRKGNCTVRPGCDTLALLPTPPTGEYILGIADFFDKAGSRHQMVMTQTRLLEWQSGSWLDIPGTGPISSSTLASGGTGYTVGDTGFVDIGTYDATYVVNTVSGSGAVLTYTLTSFGTNYTTAFGVPTEVGGGQPGVGTGFTLNIVAVGGFDSNSLFSTATVNYQLCIADGRDQIQVWNGITSTFGPSNGNGPIIDWLIDNGGTGYAVGDTGIVNTGSFDADYIVTAETGGVVSGISFAFPGTFYSNDTTAPTLVGGTQPGSGTGLILNITALGLAPICKYVFELENYLIALYTFEQGSSFPQRLRWSAPGDVTNWYSFAAGVEDRLNDLGPLVGGVKLYQIGYLFFEFGIEQVVPTGIGTEPFEFVPISSRPKGCICPHSIAVYGDDLIAYVGKDNIYAFNGTQSTAIGDAPIQGGRIGARSRIFAELALANPDFVTGYVSSCIAGNTYNAYWLNIPSGSLWMYNFDEGNWTRWIFDGVPSTINTFASQLGIEIKDLIGTIAAQTWTPATLISTQPFDGVLIGFTNGEPGLIDFSNYANDAPTGWSITGAQYCMNDRRHNKLWTRFRFVYTDLGGFPFVFSVTNELGNSVAVEVNLPGTGTGLQQAFVTDIRISGLFLHWQIVGSPGTPASFSEFTPIYEPGGEYANPTS